MVNLVRLGNFIEASDSQYRYSSGFKGLDLSLRIIAYGGNVMKVCSINVLHRAP